VLPAQPVDNGPRWLDLAGRRTRIVGQATTKASTTPSLGNCSATNSYCATTGAVFHCYNFNDFRRLAKRRLPGPIFDYIDGAADDETTYRRNTSAFEACDLIPNVLRGVEAVDMSVVVMGQRLAMPVYCSPTALQRLFHYQGERAVAAAAGKYGTMFGVSSLGTVSLEEARRISDGPQVYQLYFHKDRGLNSEMMARAKRAGIEVMMLTVDSITGGNRERDKRTRLRHPL
jgi:L-lactate dehydrogenase (cytochrome)